MFVFRLSLEEICNSDLLIASNVALYRSSSERREGIGPEAFCSKIANSAAKHARETEIWEKEGRKLFEPDSMVSIFKRMRSQTTSEGKHRLAVGVIEIVERQLFSL